MAKDGAQEASKMAQEAPKTAQETPKTHQDEPQDAEIVQNHRKTMVFVRFFRITAIHSSSLQLRSQRAHESAKTTPGWP